jgi:hypothetical protein
VVSAVTPELRAEVRGYRAGHEGAPQWSSWGHIRSMFAQSVADHAAYGGRIDPATLAMYRVLIRLARLESKSPVGVS